MAPNNQQRSELVAVLWELKQNLARSDLPLKYVHFNMLLSDEDYRNEVLRKAEESDVLSIRSLAEKARNLNVGGKLLASGMVGATTGALSGLTPTVNSPSGMSGSLNLGAPPAPAGSKAEDLVRAAAAARGGRPQTGLVGGRRRSGSPLLKLFLLLLLVSGIGGGVYAFRDELGIGASTVIVNGSILRDTLWEAKRTYVLEGIVYVEGRARLTIEPGTTILGKPGSALIVTRDAYLFARGRNDAPIVFTSAKPVGERRTSDWGGVAMLGNAITNVASPRLEGLPTDDSRGYFGGNDATHSCGVLEYARIEFAGYEIAKDDELNGLTLGACGRSTIVRYVQVHRGGDDGIEMFGGSVNLQYVVVSGADDDSIDWDLGWDGFVQFAIIQQYGDVGDSGIEADNNPKEHNAQPRSMPVVYNLTMVGSRNMERAQRAMVMRRGTGGHIRNFIITGFPRSSVDFRNKEAAELIAANQLSFAAGVIHNIGRDGQQFFEPEVGEKDNDNGFSELDYFSNPARKVMLGVDPQLPREAFSVTEPNYTPAITSPAALRDNAVPPPQGEFWDEAANFLGAVRPGTAQPWYSGWTSFPAN